MENGEDTLECITRHCIDGFVRGDYRIPAPGKDGLAGNFVFN
jgi:hypothetical protein